MVVEEFHDQKIIYHLNIDEEVNNILDRNLGNK